MCFPMSNVKANPSLCCKYFSLFPRYAMLRLKDIRCVELTNIL